MNLRLREYTEADAPEILRLNHEAVAVLSPLDELRLHRLVHWSSFFTVAEITNPTAASADSAASTCLAGFLIAMPAGSTYESLNYRWFDERLKQYLYIDRIVIAADYRGRGLGRQFYDLVEKQAVAHQLAWLACEIDVEPPNPISLAFHEKLGFREVGRLFVPTTGKTVSLRLKSLAHSYSVMP